MTIGPTCHHATAFDELAVDARSHFVLHFYASVYHLLHHLHLVAECEDERFESTLKTYPFLEKYFREMLQYFPDDLTWSEGALWWRRELSRWESRSERHLPLRALDTLGGGWDFHQRFALVLVGLVEEDSRFGSVFAHLQAPLTSRRPCLELVGHLVLGTSSDGPPDPWAVCQPLLRAGLVKAENPDVPRSEWILCVPELLWDVVRGDMPKHPESGIRHHPCTAFSQANELVVPESMRDKLVELPKLLANETVKAMVVRGILGTERLEVVGAVARALELGVVEVDGTIASESQTSPSQLTETGPLCTMLGAMPAISLELAPGETREIPPLPGYAGPIGVVLGLEGGLTGAAVDRHLTLNLPLADAELRSRHWRIVLADHPVEDLDQIVRRFHLPGGLIRQAAKLAIANAELTGHKSVGLEDVREACRSLYRQALDTLATHLETDATWDLLIVGVGTQTKLEEVERRCRHREALLDRLGRAFGTNGNRGVRALFSGASGTGKTLAAKILSAELGMDLYRVDLAAVVNKYIGETEKNLHRVLTRAEALDVVLLLDEGDALLGKRTDVHSANDRYANLETNYLLQRLEGYQGIVLITTNSEENIDSSFQRRMDVVVNFVRPAARERFLIWKLHLPTDHTIHEARLREIALRCELTGGQIRNAAMLAALLALDERCDAIEPHHLEQALRSEYRKAGAIYPLEAGDTAKGTHEFVEDFIHSLQAARRS